MTHETLSVLLVVILEFLTRHRYLDLSLEKGTVAVIIAGTIMIMLFGLLRCTGAPFKIVCHFCEKVMIVSMCSARNGIKLNFLWLGSKVIEDSELLIITFFFLIEARSITN